MFIHLRIIGPCFCATMAVLSCYDRDIIPQRV